MPADAGQGSACCNTALRGSCLSFSSGENRLPAATRQAGAPMPAACSPCGTPTSVRASSGATGDFSRVAHTAGRKRKAALGMADPGGQDPMRHVGEAAERRLIHTLSQWR